MAGLTRRMLLANSAAGCVLAPQRGVWSAGQAHASIAEISRQVIFPGRNRMCRGSIHGHAACLATGC